MVWAIGLAAWGAGMLAPSLFALFDNWFEAVQLMTNGTRDLGENLSALSP